MSFKDILSKLDQLSEGDVKHTGTYGTSYGKEDVRDQYGHKIGRVDKEKDAKKEMPKKGRGRPKKDVGDAGVKFDASALSKAMGGQKPKKDIGKTSVKHSLKEYFEQIDEMMTQQPIPVVGKEGSTQQTGAGFLHIDDNSPAGQAMKDAISKLAQQKKAQIVVPTQGQKSGTQQPTATSGGATNQPAMAEEGGEKWIQKAIKHPGAFTKKAKAAGMSTSAFANKVLSNKEDYPAKTEKQANLAKTLGKLKEADLPPQDGLMGAGLGAGRDQGVTEGAKKPDANKNGIPDYAEDGKGPNDLKKKKKVDESMDNRLKAAHHRGKAHALAKESYNCKYDDMEEARMYHEGFKEGLDECYGQVPIRGQVVGEEDNVVDDMASFGAHTPTMEDDVEEGNAFTAALAKTPQGGKFSVGGKTFTDRSGYDAKVDETMFESWDNQLGSLLEEYKEIQEGMTVSISKGQQGSPDSVSVTAQDQEADKLLQLVKSAGLGLFGDEHQHGDMGVPTGDEQHGGVDVVGDHDGMMALIKKASGGDTPGTLEPATAGSEDYADEEGQDNGELDIIKQLTQAIGAGGDEEKSSDDSDEEKVDETNGDQIGGPADETEEEYMDQEEETVAEDNPPDSGVGEFQAMDAEIAQDNAAASSHGGAENSNLEEEETCETCNESPCSCEDQVDESYANADDDGFQADIDFMTKIISGGLNKQKSTGQTTIPVIAGQDDRMGYSVQESVSDWKKLAGLK